MQGLAGKQSRRQQQRRRHPGSSNAAAICKATGQHGKLLYLCRMHTLILQAKERAKQISRRIGRPVVTDGQYEDIVAQAGRRGGGRGAQLPLLLLPSPIFCFTHQAPMQ